MQQKLEKPFLFIGFFLSVACSTTPSSTLPDTFSQDNVMKVHQGMSSSEILDLFGKPKSISQDVCGGKTGRTWSCTTWEYGQFPYDRATFTFSGDNAKFLLLNSFRVDRQ